MDDVTDLVFRDVINKLARPSVFVTEFTNIDGLLSVGKDKVMRKLKYSKQQRPVVAQIWGSNPEHFEKAASIVEELGFDGIDINMGCPDKKVMKNNAGAALVNNKELVQKIILAARKGAPSIPLSIKTRLDRNSEKTTDWLKFLLTQDIQLLTLHARDAKSMSKIPANWEQIGNLVELRNKINKNILIIGNGDVTSYEEVLQKTNQYGVDGVMIGRGVFHNPWVFEQKLKEHSVHERLEILLEHTSHFTKTWGKTRNFETMKKFFKIYVKNFPGADELRQNLMQTKNYEDVETIVKNFLKILK